MNKEYRAFGSFSDTEAVESGELIIVGIPVVFNQPTVLFTRNDIEYKEVIESTAFDGCDMTDFVFYRNHGTNDSTVYARTRNGSLNFDIAADGMHIRVLLDGNDRRHSELYNDIKSKRVDKMSFAFTVKKDRYDSKTNTRHIEKFAKIYDVSAVDFPAYSQTSICARSINSWVDKIERKRKIAIAKTYL